MGRPGYGAAGVGSVAAVFLALCSTQGAQAFVVPPASRGGSAVASWPGRGSSVAAAGRGEARPRTPRGLEVAAKGSAVESSSVAEEDGMRTKKIEGFSNKVWGVCVPCFRTYERCSVTHVGWDVFALFRLFFDRSTLFPNPANISIPPIAFGSTLADALAGCSGLVSAGAGWLGPP